MIKWGINMLHTIKNEYISITVSELGAELNSIILAGKELIWQGDARWWTGHAPILFPVVGALEDGSYMHDGSVYSLNNHGFARRSLFTLVKKTERMIVFSLCDSNDTRNVYPFEFELVVRYKLSSRSVYTSYQVMNKSSKEMFFSIGGHPAFNCPLYQGEIFEDYEIIFNDYETAGNHVISENGLVSNEKMPFFNNTNKIPLDYELFNKHETLVFSNLNSTAATLRSCRTGKGVTMDFTGFPYFAIWTKPGAPFVCLEPWHGVDDSPISTGVLRDKTGIVRLSRNAEFSCGFTITPIA